jgi:hypothetical protein
MQRPIRIMRPTMLPRMMKRVRRGSAMHDLAMFYLR